MTDQTIPAEKVRALIEAYEDGETNPLLSNLRALLPAQQPTTGLLGRWAKHPDHGDVMCGWDHPDSVDDVLVIWPNCASTTGVSSEFVSLDSIAFPEQTIRPEDVPVGEAWLVELLGEGEQRAFKTDKDEWQTSSSNPLAVYNIPDDNITLIAPLTPEHPGKDNLQARYDALDAKYREAQERIKEMENHVELTNFEDLPEHVRAVINKSINDFTQGRFVSDEEFK